MLINIFRVGVRRRGPDSFQWCPATGQVAMGKGPVQPAGGDPASAGGLD